MEQADNLARLTQWRNLGRREKRWTAIFKINKPVNPSIWRRLIRGN